MNKEELIQLHTLMVLMKDFLEKTGIGGEFSKYNSLHISPMHVHRNKYEHKNAIFILGNEILSKILNNSNMKIDNQDIVNCLSETSELKNCLSETSGLKLVSLRQVD